MTDTKDLAVVQLPTSVVLYEPERFQEALQAESRKRAMLEEFIRSQLKDGIDYGRIRIHRKACEERWNPEPKCRCPESKPMLFKPGSEKIASVLHLRATFIRDVDVVEMLGVSGEGVVCFICHLVTEAGDIAGEGRGACGLERTDVNARIKIAEKRAQTDAVLRVASLSDTFGQDMEDVAAPEPVVPVSLKSESSVARQYISEAQVKRLWSIAGARAKTLEAVDRTDIVRDVLKRRGLAHTATITPSDYDKISQEIERWEPPTHA